MLVAERHQKIIELVNERKSIRVTELSQIFTVTEETIRRDLGKLEAEQKLTRSHGGAIRIRSIDSLETPYKQREITNIKEKQEIALEAVKQVIKDDKIILDASTTAWYMAKALPDIRITVITNSIKIAMELSSKRHVTVISTGGILLPESLSYVGHLGESSLEFYHVNKAFISCEGLHLEHGISELNEQQARIKKKMIESAEAVYIMIDYNKFGVQAFSRINGLDTIDYIITNSKIADQTKRSLTDQSLKLIMVQQ